MTSKPLPLLCSVRSRRFRRPGLLAALAVSCVAAGFNPAAAGTLRIIPTDSDIPTYVDTATLNRQGKSVELVYVSDYRISNAIAYEEPRFRSEATRALIDCEKHTYAVRSISGYSDRAAGGNRTSSETITGEDAKPQPIESKTTLDYVAKFACAKK